MGIFFMRESSLIDVITLVCILITAGNAQVPTTLFPAIITFGDSTVDVGNNDYLHTIFKANFPPYGRDFINNKPTGRFCNGKLATDLIADILGFQTYPLAYLSPKARGKNLLIGANFASAASGYDDNTAILNNAITIYEQLDLYKEYMEKLIEVSGDEKAISIIKDGLYIVSFGSSDFLQNYYINPLLNQLYSPDQYGSYLINIFSDFIQDLYDLGARKIGVTSLPPMGCLPAAITIFGFLQNGCIPKLNYDAQEFNEKINSEASNLHNQLPGLKIVILDIYTPLYNLVQSPSSKVSGFTEARRGCCGTGLVEATILLCNPISFGTCDNATTYVFWDSLHPSENANQVLADSLIVEGIKLI
ncbi:GDSL esterase/lipase APG-like [Impatiens glandulifera]|uniref:GDSL esterase/lipase APG-like n=1 Tax=Impatiens glandulifera TaxID=253017 RepID=UPI001FB0B70E|nr:GDSL esterase/lipase APG-like [Impatiens glandulifera]